MPQDTPCTNAGLGSSLARDGTVECDASIMLGTGEFGAVGAVKGMPTVSKRYMYSQTRL